MMESREERIRVSKELVKHRDWIRGVLNWKTYKLSPSEMESVEEKFKILYPGEYPTWATLCEMVAFLCYEVVPGGITEQAIGALSAWVNEEHTEPTEELRDVMEAYFEANWYHNPYSDRDVLVMHRKVAASRLMIECIRFIPNEQMNRAEDVAMKLAEELPEEKEEREW